MTVTARPKDTDGINKQAQVTSLQATPVKSTAHQPAIAAALDQAQRELVEHFIDHGRVQSASMIVTMMGSATVAPAGLDAVGVTMFKNIVALATRVTNTKPGAVQEAMNQQLDQEQRAMMRHCLDIGFVTAANIIANMS